MWLPRWFYELLPAIYAVGGVACLACFEHRGPAILSAGLLFAAAALVALWRHSHRAGPSLSASLVAATRRGS